MPQHLMSTDPEDWGPRIDVRDRPGITVNVVRAYRRPSSTGATKWNGRVLLMSYGEPLLEVEVSLVSGDRTDFVGLPQRSYVSEGMTKYQRLVNAASDGLPVAMQEAIERHIAGERGRIWTPADAATAPRLSDEEIDAIREGR